MTVSIVGLVVVVVPTLNLSILKKNIFTTTTTTTTSTTNLFLISFYIYYL